MPEELMPASCPGGGAVLEPHREPSSTSGRPTVLVMARAPGPEAKTRLGRALPPAVREALVAAMLDDTLETLLSLDLERVVACHPSAKHAAFRARALLYQAAGDPFADAGSRVDSGPERHPGAKIHWWDQGEGSLGDRLHAALRAAFARGSSPVLVIGSDSPNLPRAVLEQALQALSDSDVAIGPALDGGFYLLGMRSFYPQLLENIPWGTSEVCKKTLEQARLAALRTTLLPHWTDLDEPEDLLRFGSLMSELEADTPGRPLPGHRTWAILKQNPPVTHLRLERP